MTYIEPQDYDYIINKYHRQDRPFNPFSRFVTNDGIFEEGSGLSSEETLSTIRTEYACHGGSSHAVTKAKAFAYVLGNTRISCDKHDIFPAIHMISRPLDTLISEWRRQVFEEFIPETEKKRLDFNRQGVGAVWPDFDHSVPNWDLLFQLGFKGILENSRKIRGQKENLTADQIAFYDGIEITYTAILSFLSRLADQAREDGNSRMYEALIKLKDNPPASFYEALLFDYLYFIISEHIESLQVRSLSNFDRLFYKYYQNDLNSGVSEEKIQRDLAYFLLQFTAIGNYWNQPVFLGGCKEDESTEINELSYLFLDVYDKMGLYNPKIQIKVADSTPKDFLLKALDMIRRGNNSIVFIGDKTVRKALENVGATREDARLCNIKGCYEYSVQEDMTTGSHSVSLMKPLEYVLHEGCDGVTGEPFGLSTPPVKDYQTFEQFFEAYKQQLGFVIERVMETVNSFEEYLSFINPQSMLSATYQSCLKKGVDALCGGAKRNDCYMLFGFMADICDSLAVIKKYVFEQKTLTLEKFVSILDADFRGNELLRFKILADRDKFGNNKDLPDQMAKEIVDFCVGTVCGRPNTAKRGGEWNVGFHVARMSYDLASKTATSPGGRLKGEELSKNLSASMGMNREGPTAAILTTTKIDATKFTCNAPLDLGLLSSAVRGEDGLQAMYGLLMTFIGRGGHAMHINVFDADTLRAAQQNPEKYQDLQIRVCGWNVLFNHINKAEQDGFIRQAEGLV